MNKLTNTLLSLVLALLVINLALTSMVLLRAPAQSATNVASKSLNVSIAQAWGAKVVRMYNQQDHAALYATFNEKAKVKISQQQLETQLTKLFQLFGEVKQKALVSTDQVGQKGDETYYKLLFNIRTENNTAQPGTLSISLIMKDNAISLYGVRMNATQSLD